MFGGFGELDCGEAFVNGVAEIELRGNVGPSVNASLWTLITPATSWIALSCPR